MKLPANARIAREKVTGYLLVRQVRSDKSGFLAGGGFTLHNPDTLIAELGVLRGVNEALNQGNDDYAEFSGPSLNRF